MRRVRLALIVATVLAGSALVYAQANCVIINGVSSCGGVFSFLAGLRVSDGLVGTPSMAFSSETNTGWYRAGSANMAASVGGTSILSVTSTGLQINSASGSVNWGADALLTRASAGVVKLAHGTATSTAEFQVSGGSGGFLSAVKALTELTTIAAAATTTTAIQIPANAVALAVSVRVVTVIPTAATFTVTSTNPAKTWNTVAVAVAANTTNVGTLPGPTYQTTASGIVITPNLTPGAATGQVRVTIYYYEITPATS